MEGKKTNADTNEMKIEITESLITLGRLEWKMIGAGCGGAGGVGRCARTLEQSSPATPKELKWKIQKIQCSTRNSIKYEKTQRRCNWMGKLDVLKWMRRVFCKHLSLFKSDFTVCFAFPLRHVLCVRVYLFCSVYVAVVSNLLHIHTVNTKLESTHLIKVSILLFMRSSSVVSTSFSPFVHFGEFFHRVFVVPFWN